MARDTEPMFSREDVITRLRDLLEILSVPRDGLDEQKRASIGIAIQCVWTDAMEVVEEEFPNIYAGTRPTCPVPCPVCDWTEVLKRLDACPKCQGYIPEIKAAIEKEGEGGL